MIFQSMIIFNFTHESLQMQNYSFTLICDACPLSYLSFINSESEYEKTIIFFHSLQYINNDDPCTFFILNNFLISLYLYFVGVRDESQYKFKQNKKTTKKKHKDSPRQHLQLCHWFR